MSHDPSYEYDCPQFVDFTSLHDEGGADEYFNVDHEKVEQDSNDRGDSSVFEDCPSSIHKTPAVPKTHQTALKDTNDTPRRSDRKKKPSSEEPDDKIMTKADAAGKENATSSQDPTITKIENKSTTVPKIPGNICLSLADWNERKKNASKPAVADAVAQKLRQSPRLKVKRLPGQQLVQKSIRRLSTGKVPKRTASNASASILPQRTRNETRRSVPTALTTAAKAPAAPATGSAPGARPPARPRAKSHSLDGRAVRLRKTSCSNKPPTLPSSAKGPGKLTVPFTPTVLKREQKFTFMANAVKTKEQRDLDLIKEMRKQSAQTRKLAQESHKKAIESVGYVPVKAAVSPTKAESFHFATGERVKNHGMDTRQDETKGFVAGLRRYSPVKLSAPKGLTSVEPFNFAHEKKRKRPSDDTKPFQSMAEQIAGFSTNTSERFHSKPANYVPSPLMKKSLTNCEPTITIPMTPKLETRGRTRAAHIPSQRELEEKEIEECRKNQFKAHPVNDKIFKNPNLGVKKVEAKPPTVPEGFNLEAYRRVPQAAEANDEEARFAFQAKPIPKGILEHTVGVKPPREIPLTHPESPAFALKNRLKAYRKQAEEKLELEESQGPRLRRKPLSVPHPGIPFQPKLDHKTTEVAPFSFEQRNKEMMAHKEQVIQQVYEEERRAREFHAQPLPDPLPDTLPPKRAKIVTRPEPFQIESVKRKSNPEDWGRKVEEDLRQQRSLAQFKARPPVSLLKEPFIPKKSTKPLTDLDEFPLHTEKRSESRLEWEQRKKEQEQQVCEHRRAQEKLHEEDAEREARRQRTQAVHKAQGIHRYKQVEVRPSDKPLTIPATPKFSDRFRSKTRKSN